MKLRYRPEVDGLRAIAVLLVIFHHLGVPGFSGGYVGVDVFFVISGYLITSILQADIAAGTFTFANFYKRRVIRLAPAYFLVLAVTSVAASVFMLPAELLNYSKSILSSTFFVANFHMWKEVGGYFGSQADLTPLLHLWSLAVEEQFYIFWPLLLLLLNRLLPFRLLVPLMLVGWLAGLAVSEWGVRNYPAAAYYLLPTRFFELMTGALIAFLPRPVDRSSEITFGGALAVSGLLLVAWSAIRLSIDSRFPGIAAAVPCLGTALFIYFSRTGEGGGKLLAMQPMVRLGRISYPAYLWHWPIIAFLNQLHVPMSLLTGAMVLVATLCLAEATYRFVELPARAWNAHAPRKVLARGFLLPAIASVSFAAVLQFANGFPQRFPDDINRKSDALLSFPNRARGRCNEGDVTHPLPEKDCVLGIAARPVDFLLVGDSHANSISGMLDVMAKDAGLRGYDITQSNTAYLPGVSRVYEQDGEQVAHVNFKRRNDTLEELIRRRRYPAVVLAGYFEKYYAQGELRRGGSPTPKAAFEDGFRAALRSILSSGSKAYVVEGYPTLGEVPYDCSLSNARFGTGLERRVRRREHMAAFAKWKEFLAKLQTEFPSLVVIRPDLVLCNGDWCKTEEEGLPLYRDSTHLNYVGSALLGQLYIEQLGNPLRPIAGRMAAASVSVP